MSHHRDKRNSPELDGLLRQHRLATDTPSQLSDAFRLGYWSAQAEIARLQAEVERLTYDLEWMTTDRGKWQDSATRRHFERDAAHNDAIEAAAMVQVLRINEGGRRYMSGLSPEARAAIRALKITTQEQTK